MVRQCLGKNFLHPMNQCVNKLEGYETLRHNTHNILSIHNNDLALLLKNEVEIIWKDNIWSFFCVLAFPINKVFDSAHKENIKRARGVITPIVGTMKLCRHLNNPLRGHMDSTKHCPEVEKRGLLIQKTL